MRINGVGVDYYGTLVEYPGYGLVRQFYKELVACGLEVKTELFEAAISRMTDEFLTRLSEDRRFAWEFECRKSGPNLWRRERILTNLGITADVEEMTRKMYESYLLSEDFKLDPQALDLLRILRKMGLKLGIISNGPAIVLTSMERNGLIPLVDCIVISGAVGCEKPGKEIFALALAHLELPARECMYLGDTIETDVIGASEVGLQPVLIDRDDKYPYVPRSCIRIRQLCELVEVLSSC